MGNFYFNHSVKTTNPVSVANLMRGRRAIVTAPVNGWVLVADEEAGLQHLPVIEQLGQMLSSKLKTYVFAVLNHDDDVLLYELYWDGTRIDTYNSRPHFFDDTGPDGPPEGGKADILCKAFDCVSIAEIESILREEMVLGKSEKYLFALDRHLDLMRALGQPGATVGFGYNYASQNDLPEELEGTELIFIRP